MHFPTFLKNGSKALVLDRACGIFRYNDRGFWKWVIISDASCAEFNFKDQSLSYGTEFLLFTFSRLILSWVTDREVRVGFGTENVDVKLEYIFQALTASPKSFMILKLIQNVYLMECFKELSAKAQFRGHSFLHPQNYARVIPSACPDS